MTRCIIIDDEPYARELLASYIAKVPFLQLEGSFSSGLEAIQLLDEQRVDLIFLDIRMPEINGIDLLKALSRQPQVIFTTAYAEFALDGYELNVVDYLLKPFDFTRFLKAVNKCQPVSQLVNQSVYRENKNIEYLFIKDGRNFVKVQLKDIHYIQGLKDYVKIVTDEKAIISLQTLKDLNQILPENQFMRVHNSFIVGLDHVATISKNKIDIEGKLIPIGETFKKRFFKILTKITI